MPIAVREGINAFLEGFIQTENMRFTRVKNMQIKFLYYYYIKSLYKKIFYSSKI